MMPSELFKSGSPPSYTKCPSVTNVFPLKLHLPEVGEIKAPSSEVLQPIGTRRIGFKPQFPEAMDGLRECRYTPCTAFHSAGSLVIEFSNTMRRLGSTLAR